MFKRNADLFIRLGLWGTFVLVAVIIAVVITGNAETTSGCKITTDTTDQNTFITQVYDELAEPETTEAETAVEITLETAASESTLNPTLKTDPILYPELDYTIYYDLIPTERLVIEVRTAIQTLSNLNKSEYTTEAIRAINDETSRLRNIESRLTSDIQHYLKWEKEHYYAAKVWEYFMQRGFSSEVVCAIIGNMMIETSGGSLNLNPTIYSPGKSYYGLCQWSQKYYPETKGLSFTEQLEYLFKSMEEEFNTFGKKYRKNFNYADFLEMTDTAEAALAFAKAYERCGSGSYKMRQSAAIIAFEYFDLNN